MDDNEEPKKRPVMFGNCGTAIRVESGGSVHVDGVSVKDCGKFIDADGAKEIDVKNITEINTEPKSKKLFSGWLPKKD